MSDKPKVLLVEDDPAYTHLIREMLTGVKTTGPVVPAFDLECADRLSTGLERLAVGGIDVILLDLSLPDSQGLDTFAKTQAQAPRVPIIVLTALDDEMVAVKAVRDGAQDYLVKGQVNGNLLVRAMRYAIERKRTEEALRGSKEKFRTFTESAPVAIMIYQDYQYVYANPEAEQITGYTHEELQQMKFWDFLHPDYRDMAIEGGKALERGESPPYRAEFKIITKNGDEKWLDGRLEMIEYEGKRAALISAMDVTERMRAEEALRESEERFREVFKHSQDALYKRNLETGRYEYMSPAIAKITGYTPDEVMAMSPDEIDSLIHPEDIEWMNDLRRNVLETPQGHEMASLAEYRVKCKDGSYRWISDHYALLRGPEGRPLFSIASVRDITDRKRSEEALTETNQLLETIFEHTHMLVTYLDPQFNFVRVNRAYAEADQREPSFFPGKNHFDLYPNAENEEIFRRVVETGEPYFAYAKPFEYTEHPERGVSYWDWSLVPIKDPKGAVTGLVLTLVDVTERKRAEEALRESEDRLKLALEAANDGLFDWNMQTGEAYFSPRYYTMLGYEPYEMPASSDTWTNLLHPDDREHVLDTVNEYTEGKRDSHEIEYRMRMKSGEWRWILSRGKATERDVSGRPIRMVGTHVDITERKRAEEALRESEERYRSLFEGAGDHIFVVDQDGQYVTVNPSALKAGGFTLEDVVGKGPRELFPGDAEFYISQYRRVFETEEPISFERELGLPDGLHWFSVTLSPIKDAQGHVTALTGISRDITDRKRAEEQIQASLREKEVLLKEIHHRVKNNLQVISSLLDLQADSIQDPRFLEVFQESQHRIKSMALVHEKLYQSQSLASIDVTEYIQSLVGYLFSAYGGQAYAVTPNIQIDGVPLDIDTAVPCGLIINELVSNALKHAFPPEGDRPPGEDRRAGEGDEIRIELRDAGEEDQLTLVVSDNGVGLPPDLDWQDPPSLGLQLVSLLTRQLQGTLELDTSDGTTFKIMFKRP